MSTVIAHIPAREVTGRSISGGTKTVRYDARDATFRQDDDGQWYYVDYGIKVTEAEVIDVCRTATNWTAIRQAHFPMSGFHS